MRTTFGAWLGTALLTGCSCNARLGDEGGVRLDTGSTGAEESTEQSTEAAPCPHVYFGEAERQWSVERATQSLAAADLDGDGLLDLVATLDQGDIAILRNFGRSPHLSNAKTFERPVIVPGPSAGVGVLDWNGDGRPDLVGVRLQWTVSLFENRGDLEFELVREERIPLQTVGDDLALVDMDGDGRDDIVVYGGRGLVIWPSPNEQGELEEPFALELGPVGLRRGDVGDLDGDGIPDLAIAGWTGDPFLLVAFGDGRGGVERLTPYTRPDDMVRGLEAAIVDVDGDGVLDVVVAGRTWEEDIRESWDRKPRILWMRGTGGGNLEEAVTLEPSPGASGWTLAHADLERNGLSDIVVLANGLIPEDADPIDGAFHLMSYRDGALEVVAPGFIEAGTAWGRILIQDFDGDGFEDFVRATSQVTVHWGCPR